MNRITYISFSRIEKLGLVYILDISIYTLVIYMCHTTVATLLGLFVLVVLRFDVGFSFHKRSTSSWQHVYSYMLNARLVSSLTNDVQGRRASARTIHRIFRNIGVHIEAELLLNGIELLAWILSTSWSAERISLKVYFY